MNALATRVEDAVAALPETEQRVLALRVREEADYRTIAEAVGGRREGVADLLVSARLSTWARLRDGTAPPRRTPSCGPARRVLAAQADGEAVGAGDAERVREHLIECEPCRAARLAMREAELACRAWSANRVPSVPPPPNRARAVPETGTEGARFAPTGTRGAQLAVRRRRLVAASVAVVLVVAVLIAALTGGNPAPTPAAPRTGAGSARGSGHDVVPGPGDHFCPDGERTCQ